METTIGIILGVIATILVSRYYFLRSIDKKLSVYGLLNSFVFAGITPDVRKLLQFRFKDKEVDELQQVVFLVANDGERAISNVIEPLSFVIPNDVEVLDASILHRQPDALQAQVTSNKCTEGTRLILNFPLLNKGEFFVIKLLLSGRVSIRDSSLSILADDLPRSLKVRQLPPNSFGEISYNIEWGLAGMALVVLCFPIWVSYWLYLLWIVEPGLFPYPWATYTMSAMSLFLIIPGAILIGFFFFLGIAMLGAAFFNGEFPPSRRPRFPLPKELRDVVFPYRMLHLSGEFEDEIAAPTKLVSERQNDPG
jgi:hypothetical protein